MKNDADETTLNDVEEAVVIEDEDDYIGYFLESTANSINMVERVAEANRKLYEDGADEGNSDRPKKVQFSESLINFEPETYEAAEESDDSEDENEKSEELFECISKRRADRPKTARKETKSVSEEDEIPEEIKREPTIPEEVEDDPQEGKVLLVMLPREQSSSCESVIGEEIPGETKSESVKPTENEELVGKTGKVSRASTPVPCKISKMSLDLKHSPIIDAKKRKLGLKCKKSIEGEKEGDGRKNSVEGKLTEERPTTAADRRMCCIVRTNLPNYNGFRSEYGLSAEQLQERRRKTTELRQQRRMEKMRKRQEEIRRRLENEKSFSQWLFSKRRGTNSKSTETSTRVDSLSRSDVYIQTHAIYARGRGVSYSVEYGLARKKHSTKTPRLLLDSSKRDKSISLERLFENVSPHVKHTFRIYIGGTKK